MRFFKKLVDTAVDAAKLPVDLVKDKWTLGGNLTGRDEAYTVSRAKKLADHVDGLIDEFKDDKDEDNG
jgi:hypothetical protein